MSKIITARIDTETFELLYSIANSRKITFSKAIGECIKDSIHKLENEFEAELFISIGNNLPHDKKKLIADKYMHMGLPKDTAIRIWRDAHKTNS